MTLASATLGWGIAGVILLGSGLVLCLRRRACPTGGLFAAAGGFFIAPLWAPAGATTYVGLAAVATLVAAVAVYPRTERLPVTGLTLSVVALGTPALTWVLTQDGFTSFDFVSVVLALVIVGVTHSWWRLETRPAVREPLLWVMSAGGVTGFLVWIVALPGAHSGLATAAAASVGLVGIAAVLGAGPVNKYDGRWLASQAIAWSFAIACLFAGVTLVFTLIRVWTDAPPGIVAMSLATVACGALWNPLLKVVRQTADAILFGYRPDALSAVRRVAVSVGEDPAAAVRAIQEGLVLPYAALALDGEDPIIVGTPQDRLRTFPIDAGDEQLGTLTVGVRPGDLGLSKDDERVLALALPLLVQTVRARGQAVSLQRARVLGARAREEERRRLRRDLHDGLGPRLTGIAFIADAAKLAAEGSGSLDMLDRIRQEAQTALDEIRELVYGLRPPARDELGLVGALSLKTNAFPGVAIEISAGDLPSLPAAPEVAVYRIVMEALTNIARHSGATKANVVLGRAGDRLRVEVSDNGTSTKNWTPGIDLTSMRERARELGGTLRFDAAASGSTVTAELPLDDQSSSEDLRS